jgi:hypothetical protein
MWSQSQSQSQSQRAAVWEGASWGAAPRIAGADEGADELVHEGWVLVAGSTPTSQLGQVIGLPCHHLRHDRLRIAQPLDRLGIRDHPRRPVHHSAHP